MMMMMMMMMMIYKNPVRVSNKTQCITVNKDQSINDFQENNHPLF